MYDKILKEWQKEMMIVNQLPWFQRMNTGNVKMCHYKGLLQETYHHAGINPQIQAYTTMFLPDNPREIIGMFYTHAKSEIAHDLLALNDLENLGVEKERVVNSQPLYSTMAFNAFVLYYVQFKNPLGYLGYLFHLEHLPTLNGAGYIETLKKMGIPETALSFIEEHSTVDIGHTKLMQRYMSLIKNESDLEHVLYTTRASARLHGSMLSDALANGEMIYG